MPEPGLLLVHALAPPRSGGTPVVLHRLLSGLEGSRLEVMTDRALRRRVRERAPLVLPARYRYMLKLPRAPAAFLAGAFAYLNALLAVVAGVQAAAAAWRGRARWVLSVSDGGFSVIAGALAAALARRPHVLMVFDLWEENAYSMAERRLAALLERRIMRAASAVVVYCDPAAEHYRRKHGIRCDVLATPIDLPPETPDETALDSAGEDQRAEVLVAGAIYWAQEDAVRRLARAAERVPDARVSILGDEELLRSRGIRADHYEPPLWGEPFGRRLQRAAVLFLGLSLESAHPDVIRTATPARLAEYMATGRPLLVHAPRGSHVAEYARSLDFAEVVDEPDDDALAAGLRAVLEDPETATARAGRARALARERHDVRVIQRRFREILGRLGSA